MTYIFDGYNYFMRLKRGERLSDAIEQFALEAKIEGAWLSGLGAAKDIEIGYYNLDTKEYKWRTFGGMREVVSLTGNLAFNQEGKMMFHLHGVFADDNYQTVGGHVKDLVVGATLEIFAHQAFKPLHRRMDDDIGLQLLDLEK